MPDHAGAHIAIMGAGLGGALMACYLGRAGYRVTVAERRPDPRTDGFRGGRSINLALSTRGIDALERIGLAERVLDGVVPMRGRMMHAVSGELTFQPYSKNPDDAINSVSRAGLNLALLEAASSHESVDYRFGCRCVDIDLDTATATVETDAGTERIEADVVLGADGAFSAVRMAMQRTDRFDLSQSYLEHGYKELVIPPTADGEFAMEAEALHIWPRGGFMMIALPNQDRSFTCTLFWPFRGGPGSFEAIRGEADVLPFFESTFGDAVPLMPTLVEDYRRNPTSSLVTVKCHPWHHRDKVALLGDAAHAIVPFYGQGMNSAFEDCAVLAECIDEHAPDFKAAFNDYDCRRKVNADAIADMAIENFLEMRDHVGSSAFLMRKRFEKTLHRLFPKTFIPLYNLVSFSTIPYAEARRRALAQRRAVRRTLIAAAVVVVAAAAWLVVRLT